MALATVTDPHAEVDRLYKEAHTHWRAHQTEDATALLERALQLEKEHADSLSLYGICLASRGLEFKRALGCCRRAIQRDPRNVSYLLNMAKVYKLMGDHGAAYRLLLKTWRAHPKDAQAAAELARMGVRKQPPLPFLPRSHLFNRCLGRWRVSLRQSWSRLLSARRLQGAGYET
jgi:Flp pilus assembly protein TadD